MDDMAGYIATLIKSFECTAEIVKKSYLTGCETVVDGVLAGRGNAEALADYLTSMREKLYNDSISAGGDDLDLEAFDRGVRNALARFSLGSEVGQISNDPAIKEFESYFKMPDMEAALKEYNNRVKPGGKVNSR